MGATTINCVPRVCVPWPPSVPPRPAIRSLVAAGEDVNEVEAAGNTPLHNAAYEGWAEGVELLLSLGAKVNASNNAGDTPWHWACNMGHEDVMRILEQASALSGDAMETHVSPGRVVCR